MTRSWEAKCVTLKQSRLATTESAGHLRNQVLMRETCYNLTQERGLSSWNWNQHITDWPEMRHGSLGSGFAQRMQWNRKMT